MVIAGHQPNFLPNLAFFAKMLRVDLFVINTNLRYERKDGWMRRNKIITHDGDTWLTVPTFGSQDQLVKHVKIDNSRDWAGKHMRIIEANYHKKNGAEYIPKFRKIYQKKWDRLVDLNLAFILLFRDILSIKTKLVVDSQVTGVKHTIFINVCQKYGADTILSGVGVKHYLTQEGEEEMKKNHITHRYIEKDLTPYKYSTMHYLLSEGKESVLEKIS